jgi:hypothetical protein
LALLEGFKIIFPKRYFEKAQKKKIFSGKFQYLDSENGHGKFTYVAEFPYASLRIIGK